MPTKKTDTRCFVGPRDFEVGIYQLRDLEQKDYEVSPDGKFVTVKFLNIGQPFALFPSLEDLMDDVHCSALEGSKERTQFLLRKWAELNLDKSARVEKKNKRQAEAYVIGASMMRKLATILYERYPDEGILP